MDSSIKQLERNFNLAIEDIRASRELSAMGVMASNICFLLHKKDNKNLNEYVALLKEAFEGCGEDELLKQFESRTAYTKRIIQFSNLEEEERELVFSMVGGILAASIALKAAGISINNNPNWLDWVKESILTRDDIFQSENRMQRSYPLYIRIQDLLRML